MSGFRTDMQVDGEVGRRLGVIAEHGGDLAPVMRAIGLELLQIRSQRFRRSRGPNGVPWKPKKRVINGKHLPLIFSGRMASNLALDADAAGVTLGSTLPYAKVQDQGGTIVQHPHSRYVRFRELGKAGSGQLRFAGRKSKSKRLVTKRVTYGTRIIKIPARPWIGFDGADRAAIAEVVVERYSALLRGGVR